MKILVNGWLTETVYLRRGVRQGHPLSPLLYILCAEGLASTVRNSRDIEGFLLPGAKGDQFKIGQYADDATLFLKCDRSLNNLLELIAKFERSTGTKLNRSKTAWT